MGMHAASYLLMAPDWQPGMDVPMDTDGVDWGQYVIQ